MTLVPLWWKMRLFCRAPSMETARFVSSTPLT